ncbi:hypothetical protein JCM3770_004298 [Rhodotorula araucariae]
MLRSAALVARALAPARTLARPRAGLAPIASPLPSFVAPAAHNTRLASSAAHAAPTETTNLRASAGSGQGGKKDKERAQKDRALRDKERERVKREKERAKAQRDKEREKARKAKEREKARAKAEADKLKARRLKEAVKKPRTTPTLRPPKAPQNAWTIFFADFLAEKKRQLPAGEKLATVPILVKEATPQYQALSAEAKAALHERSEEQRRAYPAILEAWKKQLTPAMIYEENLVRARRRKLGLSHKANLRVEGEPKRPATPYFHFSQQVRARGVDSDVLRGETSILKQSKLLAAAWRALPAEEKKTYEDAYLADKERYQLEKAAFDAEQAKKVGTSA